jgi:hypothetical protein
MRDPVAPPASVQVLETSEAPVSVKVEFPFPTSVAPVGFTLPVSVEFEDDELLPLVFEDVALEEL